MTVSQHKTYPVMKVEAVHCRDDKEEQQKSKVKIRHTHSFIYLSMIYNTFGYDIGTTTTEHILEG